ncbi:single-stranded DNA-binding protein [Microcella daejeonensis]|uniref:Single-stranded DNA-binding protein n=1 Tax=Microcella daejeonensis TaxID=2994971 RepID=A0A9E8S8W5_9MICO|nr:single-stranded DNA-binding protein [Microcella daejeonensis]WAB80856.1 single-stranded DNA-binding protein [Microcella daejeonensis]
MSDTITLTGLVATSPRHIVTTEGLAITSFRLASNQRRFDRTEGKWLDGDTNWYTVTAFRQLGTHVASSVQKGDRVLVTGRVRIRDWTSEEKSGTSIEIDAEAIGHDLTWGRATFTLSVVGARRPQEGAAEVESDGQTDDEARADADAAFAVGATPF